MLVALRGLGRGLRAFGPRPHGHLAALWRFLVERGHVRVELLCILFCFLPHLQATHELAVGKRELVCRDGKD